MIFHRTPDVGFHGKVEIVGCWMYGSTVDFKDKTKGIQNWSWPGLHHVSAGGKDGNMYFFQRRKNATGETLKKCEKKGGNHL